MLSLQAIGAVMTRRTGVTRREAGGVAAARAAAEGAAGGAAAARAVASRPTAAEGAAGGAAAMEEAARSPSSRCLPVRRLARMPMFPRSRVRLVFLPSHNLFDVVAGRTC